MHGIFKSLTWYYSTVIILTIFLAVFLLHPIVSHDHPHKLFGGASLLHTVISERSDIAHPTTIVVSIVFLIVQNFTGMQRALLRGVQHVNIPLVLPLRNALAQGLLHSKAY